MIFWYAGESVPPKRFSNSLLVRFWGSDRTFMHVYRLVRGLSDKVLRFFASAGEFTAILPKRMPARLAVRSVKLKPLPFLASRFFVQADYTGERIMVGGRHGRRSDKMLRQTFPVGQ